MSRGSVRPRLERFAAELAEVAGEAVIVESFAEARQVVIDFIRRHGASDVLSWPAAELPDPDLLASLGAAGIRAVQPAPRERFRASLPELDSMAVGLTGADYAVAETGSLIFVHEGDKARVASLMPPAHVAVVPAERVLEAWDDLPARLRADYFEASPPRVPPNITSITGPSRTTDIEQVLTLGVHGPRELLVVLVEG